MKRPTTNLRRGPLPHRPVQIGQVVIPSLGILSKGTGVDPSYLSRILSGQRLKSLATASKVASFLGVSFDRFWEYLQTEGRSNPSKRLRKRGSPTTATKYTGLAMIVPVAVLIPPLWIGVISGETLSAIQHAVMLPSMVVVMLRHRGEH